MKYTASVFLFLIIVLLHTVSSAQHVVFNDAERTIIRLQDERRGTDTIARYLDSKDEKVAWRAAIALANIHDTNSRLVLAKNIIKETRPAVFNAIAFALGALGPDLHSFESLVNTKALKLPAESSYDDFYIAVARTVPKDHLDDISLFLGSALDQTKVPSASRIRSASYALLELGLRKSFNEQLLSFCQALDTNDDPVVRWHCAYALARTEDSSLLSKHLDVIKVFLKDFGCPESRMFAATALGRIHNDEAGKILIEAGRSEVEWRVRVNILNAIGKLPRFSSAIDDIIKKAVMEAYKDSLTLNHVARTAIDVLDQMIAAGKVSSPDSVTVREWLTEYLPSHESHQDQSNPLRSQCMIPLARLGASEETIRDIAYFTYYRDRTTDINVWKAIGLSPDTVAFFHTLERVFTSNANEIIYILDGIHSLWELAKKDTIFLHQLESLRYAAMYRHMLIRFARESDDPAVVATTMEEIKDPLIITDSLRSEAEEYLLNYLDKYAQPQYHDHLLSIFNTVAWLKPKNDTFKIRLNGILNMAANDWGDQMIVDSAEAALSILGEVHQHRIAKLIREPIDWKTIESLPDTMLITTQYGYMFLKLLTYDAPLTSLNMFKLAKKNFFANNYFHRIVPNFVIQTGDNTGTGDGGPGYSIRTEISPVRYDDAGVVGMASSGKDTEGSQWFITHCPTPHLNTRYTIWGEIVKGRENIEKYMLNDQIMNVIPYK